MIEVFISKGGLMPKVSVIIPVYNVEKYISKCLDSLLNQTFDDFEVICVDDGSKDDSASILSYYAQKDSRIKVISQQNQGASVARNRGLDEAIGEWICFVDSDDFVHPQMLSIIVGQAEANGVDFVQYKHKRIFSENVEIMPIDEQKIKGKIVLNPALITCKKKKYSNGFAPYAKLYKRSLIGESRFIPHLQFEDYPFAYEILSKKPKTLYLDICLYFYRILEVSLCHIKANPVQIRDYLTGIKHVFSCYEGDEHIESKRFLVRDFVPMILKHQLGRCEGADETLKPLMFEEFAKELVDLDDNKLLSFRGHRLRRYLQYRKLIKNYKAN